MKKPLKPVDMSSVKTYPLRDRINKISVRDFATLPELEIDLSPFLASLPNILKGQDFLALIDDIVVAHQNEKPVIVMMGGHVIKCGLSPLLIDLVKRGVITGFAFNGASSIHDFEIALIGETSEDVAAYLQNGQFGMWEETGRLMNEATQHAADANIGMGEALGRQLIEMDAPYNAVFWLPLASNTVFQSQCMLLSGRTLSISIRLRMVPLSAQRVSPISDC